MAGRTWPSRVVHSKLDLTAGGLAAWQAMLVHFVTFHLKPELTATEREAFRQGLESLGTVPGLEGYYMGTPAATPPRSVVDASYDFAITCLFADVAAHDVYAVHPIHLAFIEAHRAKWREVKVYDVA